MTVTVEELSLLLDFCTETGRLWWKPRTPEMFRDGHYSAERACETWNARFAGKEALTSDCHGHRVGRINNRHIQAHRVIWALAYGSWPEPFIDHINGDRSDNRLCNLRLATRAENNRNSAKRRDNSSGFKGVSKSLTKGKWRADIRVDGNRISLGSFDTPEQAHAAYCAAAERLHGEFARTA